MILNQYEVWFMRQAEETEVSDKNPKVDVVIIDGNKYTRDQMTD